MIRNVLQPVGHLSKSHYVGRIAATRSLTAWLALAGASTALAQQPATAPDSGALAADPVTLEARDADRSDIIVTGTRIDIGGFDAPTPTAVVGSLELRQGIRPGIAQVLNDLPQFRATNTPQTSVANMNSGTTTADLRGLGAVRTLTLLNGRRSLVANDLNAVPLALVRQVDIVTGGAAAAYGSGAVAGVTNILLDYDLVGLELTAKTGITSRGDGARYGADAAFGTRFADNRGHFMIGGTVLRDRGILDRNSRENVGSTAVFPNPTFTPTNGESAFFLARDVNFSNASYGGLITSGALAGQTFNPDGTIRPFVFGTLRNATLMVGGEGTTINDEYPLSAPYTRYNSFARASFEFGDAKLWAEGGYANISSRHLFFSENSRGNLTISRDNPFLNADIRARLMAAGQASFLLGRLFRDYGGRTFSYTRETTEGSVGIDGSFGEGRWRYGAFYTHGIFRDEQGYENQRILANFNQAIDVVVNPATGAPTCRIALTQPGTACRPLNILGEGRASPDAVAFVFGSRAFGGTRTTLDNGGVNLRGEPFSTWAGPIGIAIGAEARREAIKPLAIDPVSAVGGFSSFNFTPLRGAFDVKEGFAEVAIPLIKSSGTIDAGVNGAARYSDYSTSGGIWSWKLGATIRLYDDLLLRATRSRDIRSASIQEFFTSPTTGTATIADPVTGTSVIVPRTIGGNPLLRPEVARSWTAGVSFAPRALSGLSLSVDYYDIEIRDLITAPTAQDVVTRCARGQLALCGQVVRDPVTNVITRINAAFTNFSELVTRGVDFEIAYRLPASTIVADLQGDLRLRVLGNYTATRASNDGVVTLETAGTVGDSFQGVPRWRTTAALSYDGPVTSLDARVRFVGGGLYNAASDISNNRIKGRAFVDLGAQFSVGALIVRGSIVNLLDLDPPLTTFGQVFYDQVGRYMNFSTTLRF